MIRTTRLPSSNGSTVLTQLLNFHHIFLQILHEKPPNNYSIDHNFTFHIILSSSSFSHSPSPSLLSLSFSPSLSLSFSPSLLSLLLSSSSTPSLSFVHSFYFFPLLLDNLIHSLSQVVHIVVIDTRNRESTILSSINTELLSQSHHLFTA